MTHIVKKQGEDLYMVEYDGKILWTPVLMEAKVFLTKMHAIDIARLLDFEVEII